MTEHDPLCVWHNPNDRAFARQPVGASGCTCDIRRAMTSHDPMCLSQDFLPADLTRFCDCERVARVRAEGRADALADLRAKAEALVAYSTPMGYEWVDGAGWVSTNKVIDTLLRADVLALLEEKP